MKIIRFEHKGVVRYGILRNELVSPINSSPFQPFSELTEKIPLSNVKLLAPVSPRTVLCVGLNYKDHAAESNAFKLPEHPLLFLKAANTVNDPGNPVILPRSVTRQGDFEAELAVVIGKTAHRVSEEHALDYVLGYTCANDVSARDCQFTDGQWARGKSLDGFCPLGPWIETQADPADLAITGKLNGSVMQSARTSQFIFNVPQLISWFSRGMTLTPGTVILTGTPSGCGFARKPPVWLKDNDVYTVEIENVGTLNTRFKVED